MNTPLHEAKASLFRALGHPVRVRILELLLDGPRPVHELVAQIGVAPANLSQQLAVLRNAGLISDDRQGGTVRYALTSADTAALFASARALLASLLSDQIDLLRELADEASQTDDASQRDGATRP
jgi:ArsR family transcriptional regulator